MFLSVLTSYTQSHKKEVEYQSDLERTAVDGVSTGPCSSGISPLNYELTHHSVKQCAIIVTWRIDRAVIYGQFLNNFLLITVSVGCKFKERTVFNWYTSS